MQEDIQPRKSWDTLTTRLVIGMVAPFLLVAIYTFSIGPVACAIEHTPLQTVPGLRDSARAFYLPLVWLHDNTILEQPLEDYLELWGVH